MRYVVENNWALGDCLVFAVLPNNIRLRGARVMWANLKFPPINLWSFPKMDKKYILIGRDEEEVVLVSPDENVVVVDNKTDAKAIVDALVLYIMET